MRVFRAPAGSGAEAMTAASRTPDAAPAPPGPDLRLLLERSAAGDQTAFSALYDATSPVVFGVALRILGHRAEAEEVAADVYLQVWKNASRYDPARGTPLSWLLVLTRSRAIDRIRSSRAARRAEQPLDLADSIPDGSRDPGQSSWIAQQGGLVRRALSALPEEQRAVLLLAYFEGLTHLEVAERLGLPVGTAKTRIRLGMLKLRDALAPVLALEGVS